MNINTVNKDNRKHNVIALTGDDGFSLEVRYEPLQHSLRILHGGVQRLFFYEQEGFFPSKASLLNEYGSVIGKMQLRNSIKGTINLFDSRIAFTNNPEQKIVILHHPATHKGLQWNYSSLQENKSGEVFRALLMILAWSVGVSALQV